VVKSEVLVVGAGFVGSALYRRLEASGLSVRLLTRRERLARRGLPSVILGNPDDPSVCAAASDGCDAVVWCAGDLLPAASPSDLAHIDDVTPLITMLRAVAARPATRFIFLSSGGAVYGRPDQLPIRESSPLMPISVYGAVKALSEIWISRFAEHTNIVPTCLRCGNIYGPGQRTPRTQGVIAQAFAAMLADRVLPRIGDQATVRDYIFVEDVIDVIIACLENRISATVLNVSSGIPTRLGDLLGNIESIAGPLRTVPVAPRPTDVDEILLNVSNLRAQMPDFDPMPLTMGLKTTWATMAERAGWRGSDRDSHACVDTSQ
jgi:UDP-glucose 4-epimerase